MKRSDYLTGAITEAGLTGDERSMLKKTGIPLAEYLQAKRNVRAYREGKGLKAAAGGIASITLSEFEERFLARNPYLSRERYLEMKKEDAIPPEHRESVREMELTAKSGIILDDVERRIAQHVPGGLEAYIAGVQREKEREKKAADRKARIESSPDLTPTDREFLLRRPDMDLDAFLKIAAEEKRMYKPRSTFGS
ncbi:MAG TPA: hypothetical protein VGQ75_10280 [Thermoanaerobaculia bacterium]|jgi:hypothetical protein|nr:hypothetical protein [Thermoanaerobaculia bacterium]